MGVEKELSDFFVKFMHPHGPATSFHWPFKDDICWVPSLHIVCKISVPVTATGRSYSVNANDFEIIKNKVKNS